MKIVCPVCGISGFLQQRGNSSRVLHYVGYVDGKRVYKSHSLAGAGERTGLVINDGNNGNQRTVLNKVGNGFFGQNRADKVDRTGFEPVTSALRMRRSYQTELPARGFSL
jgi:hypothetical protein